MPDRSGWPRVTKVIAAAGLIDTAFMTEFDRERGSALHQCAAYLLDGTLDRASVDPAIANRLAQFEKFMVHGPRPVAVEAEVWSESFRYAGRLDMVAEWGTGLAIFDIKGPTRAAWHGLQLAAYQHAYAEMHEAFPVQRYTLHLSDTDYRLIQHKDWQDWPRFVAALKNYGSENDRTSHA